VATILLIDDDPALLRALRIGLSARGHEVVLARTAEEGVTQAALAPPDVVILDLGLPDFDGTEACKRIRSFSAAPIIVLSAAGDEARKVAALDAGADDYVTKPFGMAELEARLRAALRRATPPSPAGAEEITLGPLRVDTVHRGAWVDGARLELTARELDLLTYLARHAGKVCTHQMILREVWGSAYATESHYLRVYAHRLRRKLGPAGAMLQTRPGIGYELVEDPVAPESSGPSGSTVSS
jgi:two-component system KDP operon response regulator KdpE